MIKNAFTELNKWENLHFFSDALISIKTQQG